MLHPVFLFLTLCTTLILHDEAGASHCHSLNSNPGEWKLVNDDDGVQTFNRWITNSEGLTYRERKGEMTIHCSMKEAVKMISDPDCTPQWMNNVEENYCLARLSSNEWYTYTLFSIPWPFSKRDLISLYKLYTEPVTGTVSIDILCKDRYAALKPEITRLTNYTARWRLTQLTDNNIHICFTASSATHPVFPRYIQDPVIERIFHNNLVKLREILAGSR